MVSEDVITRVTGYIRHQASKPRADIITMVREAQDRYAGIVSQLSDDAATKVPAAKAEGETEWCARELTRHVIGAEAGVAAIVQHTSRGEKPPPRGGIGMQIAEDERPFAAIVAQLKQTNADLVRAIEEMPDAPDTTVTVDHPFFGPLNCLEWAVFQRVHDSDHIQHVERIIRETSGG